MNFEYSSLKNVIVFFWIQIIQIIGRIWKTFQKEEVKKIELPVKTEAERYVDKHTERFMKSFEQQHNPFMNYNIHSIFYSKNQYQEMLKDPNNKQEKQWKTRVLIEHTPRGNVIMYYDPYKLGFTYYSDQHITYNILNAVAMKYVLKFQCRDFFMDEQIIPESFPSPLLTLLQEDKKEKETVEKEKDKDADTLKQKLKSAPFAKFKNYNKTSSKTDEKNKDTKTTETVVENAPPEKPKERNRFINLGKTSNFNILQPMKKKKSVLSFSSKIADSLFENTNVQKEVFNYRDFKRMKEASQ
jgi:hypothetical protein